MASFLTQQQAELTCPACHEVFKYPVILSCAHNFCKRCLLNWHRENGCPSCGKLSKHEPIFNSQLQNMCKIFLEERHQSVLCVTHEEKLKLFCLDDKQPICLLCQVSKQHINHRIRPIDEAAVDLREQLNKDLMSVQEKLKSLDEVKSNWYQTEKRMKVQAQHIETQIKEHFKNLRQFLQKEEDARLFSMREEEAQKSQVMKEKIEGLNREMMTLSDSIRAAEDQLEDYNDVSFLKNYKATEENIQLMVQLPDPQPVSGTLMDVAQHLGNLSFSVWDKMKEIVSYTPVILDPNTAYDELILSDDLTCVTLGGATQQLPDNPERCSYLFVQGSEGFDSGTHSWDVEVVDHTSWALGVSEQSYLKVWGKFWLLEFCDGKYKARSSGASTNLSINKTAQRIRVQLDWLKGKLYFTDPVSNTHLHTFTLRRNLTERLFPVIVNYNPLPLKVLPKKVCVTLEHTS